MARVLVLEKTGIIQAVLGKQFSGDHIAVDATPLVAGAMEKLKRKPYDVLIWDAAACKTEQSKGLELLDRLTKDSSRTFTIVVTDRDGGFLPVDRLKAYSHRTLMRPINQDEICDLVTEAVHQQAAANGGGLNGETPIPLEFEGMLGISLPMTEVFQKILHAAPEDITVLITGETGTGKDMVASAIHRKSTRKNAAYVAVNTGAVPSELIASELFGHEKGAYTGATETRRGHFEEADHGTIFLDEISTMDERAQVSLLRVLETKTFRRVGGEKNIRVDVRVIAATNENLEEAVKARRFREDLFYRLDVFHIHLPALRQRPGGVTLLASHFVRHYNVVYKKTVRQISPDAFHCLRRYPWPGNVREIKNVIQRAVLMAQREDLTLDLLPARIQNVGDIPCAAPTQDSRIQVGMTLEAVEKQFVLTTLEATGGNKKEAALKLGISRRAIYNKLKKHGIA